MDKDFFGEEIEGHSGMLYRVAYMILNNDDDCKYALQDTVLKHAFYSFSSLYVLLIINYQIIKVQRLLYSMHLGAPIPPP